MTTLEKLLWMQANAHALYIEVNDHRAVYEPIADVCDPGDPEGIGRDMDDATRAECIRRNHVVVIQCYPNKPVGFVRVADWDFERAVVAMYEAVRKAIERNAGTGG